MATLSEHVNAEFLRLWVFVLVLLLMSGWESWRPFRPRPRGGRRWTNLLLAVVDAGVLRLFFPMLAVGVAHWATQTGFGVLNIITMPVWCAVVLSLLLLDLLVYWQHRLFHRIPVFWRMHAMHHSDVQFDASTGLRFHPLEIVVSMLLKMGVVAVLGAPLLAVVLFEMLLNASALFNHANIKLPTRFEYYLRGLIVTPDMHRIHHSVNPAEHHRNFGFMLSVWDRLFNSYCREAKQNPQTMELGLKRFRQPEEQTLKALLIQPFRAQ